MAHERAISCQGKSYAVIGRERIKGRSYLLLERLTGGERRKYLAFCPATGALHLLHRIAWSPEALQLLRVLRRAELNRFSFPALLEFDRRGSEAILVCEWVAGESLEDRLRRRARISPIMAFRLFRSLAHSVHFLNRFNVIHGDIKPANLIIPRESLRLVLIDFGSSWTVERHALRLAGDGRTDAYASPEQHAQTQLIDNRSDIYSASAVAYRMLTGELPYANQGGAVCTLSGYRPQAPSTLCRERKKIPRDLWSAIDAITLRGLALEPAQRFPGTDLWLAQLNEVDALMKVRPRLSFLSRLILALIHRLVGESGPSG